MAVLNIHERVLPATAGEVGALIDGLAGAEDRLWPADAWPPMRLDAGLAPGSSGGHGPVRYTVTAFTPGQWVRFAFTAPRGLHGFHELSAHPRGDGTVRLCHTLAATLRGPARLTWPLFYRWMHDALLEDSLDRAERTLTGTVRRPTRHSRYVRLLRRAAARRR
ncbi:SRPBCC family protein [Kitasatospora camelliae]|uniref:SRPBCC family protein n=1 Tax=Kitasatospora camelliae TaxID=3156397 RepID=A0AAU8K8Z2_9ACTN